MKFTPVHYLRVASHFWPWERAFWLGLFHDSIEDGWATCHGLQRLFGARFAADVQSLTRMREDTYATYIRWIKFMPETVRRVKRADLAENYARAPASLRKRYAKAMAMLA